MRKASSEFSVVLRVKSTWSSTTLLGFNKSATVGAKGEAKSIPNARESPVKSYINGTLLSLLVSAVGLPSSSRLSSGVSGFGLMKFNWVLSEGVSVSELALENSKLANRFSPCHSPPNLNISVSVIRAPVSLLKRRFGSSSSTPKLGWIVPLTAAWMLPKFTPSREPKLTVSNSVGKLWFNTLPTPEAWTRVLSWRRSWSVITASKKNFMLSFGANSNVVAMLVVSYSKFSNSWFKNWIPRKSNDWATGLSVAWSSNSPLRITSALTFSTKLPSRSRRGRNEVASCLV